jgi:hypothetical protein
MVEESDEEGSDLSSEGQEQIYYEMLVDEVVAG